MPSLTVSILDGSTYVVSDPRGDIDASPIALQGLFHRDSRFLSCWRLSVDGHRLDALGFDDSHYFLDEFLLVPGAGGIGGERAWAVLRRRAIGDGFHEDLAVYNHAWQPLQLRLRIDAAADFADLLDVANARATTDQTYRRVERGRLVLGHRQAAFVRETWISSDRADARLDPGGITFDLIVPSRSVWSAGLEVVTARAGRTEPKTRSKYARADGAARLSVGVGSDEWLAKPTRAIASPDDRDRTYRRSLVWPRCASTRWSYPTSRSRRPACRGASP